MSRDPIEDFFKTYGQIYATRLNPEDQRFVMDQLEAEKAKQQGRRDERLTAAAEIEDGMWEGHETERTAYRFWKPERTVEAGDAPLEFPTDYRLDALVPWERGTSQLDEGIQVYEMTGHEWLKEGDIVTTPEGQGFVIDPTTFGGDPPQKAPDFAWSGSYSETVDLSNLAPDRAKGMPEAERGFTEAEKEKDVKELGHVIDDREHHEATWKERVEGRMQASLYEGRGHTDERMIRSAGQEANSWADAKRPEKGPQDMERAIKEMGLGPAIERQKAEEAEKQKGQEQGLERGGEGIER